MALNNARKFSHQVLTGYIKSYRRLTVDSFEFDFAPEGDNENDTLKFVYFPCQDAYARTINGRLVTVTLDENNTLLGLKALD